MGWKRNLRGRYQPEKKKKKHKTNGRGVRKGWRERDSENGDDEGDGGW